MLQLARSIIAILMPGPYDELAQKIKEIDIMHFDASKSHRNNYETQGFN